MKITIYKPPEHKAANRVVRIKEFSHYISIDTYRLEIKSLNQDDFELLITQYSALMGKAANVTLYCDGKPWEKNNVIALLQSELSKWQSGNPFAYMSIYDKETQQFIGFLSLKHHKSTYATVGKGHNNVVEIGYILDDSFWGKGLGSEVALAAKKYIKHMAHRLNDLHASNIPNEMVATVHPDNTGSRKILEKTLKVHEEEILSKFDSQRLLFFRPIKLKPDFELNPKRIQIPAAAL